MTQAERMVKRSKLELTSGQEGDNVAVPIPHVDRGSGDTQSILGIIIDRDENDMTSLLSFMVNLVLVNRARFR